jgi:hypothetical protein
VSKNVSCLQVFRLRFCVLFHVPPNVRNINQCISVLRKLDKTKIPSDRSIRETNLKFHFGTCKVQVTHHLPRNHIDTCGTSLRKQAYELERKCYSSFGSTSPRQCRHERGYDVTAIRPCMIIKAKGHRHTQDYTQGCANQ